MKNVVIVFGGNMQPSDTPFSRPAYQASYEVLYPLAEQSGIKLYRAPFGWFNYEKNVFSQAWTFDTGRGWYLAKDVRPDLIEDRAKFSPENHEEKLHLSKIVPLLNDPEFTKIANSKYETSVLLPQHFKPYRKVNDVASLEIALAEMDGQYIVAKPEFGSGGKGVVIDTREKLLQQKNELSYPLILQEFIDSSHGIPGITPGYHDLRLVFINDELIYSYIRIPKEGSFLANVAQGGSMKIIEREDLPASLDIIIEDVQKAFARFPKKIYTIDLIFDEHARPWIVELNTMPGVYFAPGQEATQDRFYQALVDDFNKTLNEGA